jgi:hypothetical protein
VKTEREVTLGSMMTIVLEWERLVEPTPQFRGYTVRETTQVYTESSMAIL